MSATFTGRALRAWPTLLKVSFAEAVAYRAEFLIWILTTTMPLIMMALMRALARDGNVGGYDAARFTTYYLAVLLVRMLTGAWVVWEMNMDIRQGTMALKLLRPIHPVVTYASDNLAALPLRGAVAIPLVGVLLVAVGGMSPDPAHWAIAVPAILGAWAINFLVMCAMGCLAFFAESAMSLFEVWLGVWMLLSGYMLPLDLFPPWVVRVSAWLPFRLMTDLPVRILTGGYTVQQGLIGIGEQLLWIAGLLLLVRFAWRRGLKRYSAYGG